MRYDITREQLCENLRAAINDLNRPQTENMCTALETRFEDADVAPLRLRCSFPCRPWEHNRIGRLHGGAVAAMLDQAMGLLFFGVVRRVPPTVQISVSYLRPAGPDGRLVVECTAGSTGKTFWHVTCTAYMEDAPDKPVATAAGVYYGLFQAE